MSPFRYVAIGDSQSEGLGDDPWPDGTPRGFTDRLAEILALRHGQVDYANLAVRGLQAGPIRDTQVDVAVAMRPDLVTVTAGVNDALRSTVDFARLETVLDDLTARLRVSGAQVVLVPAPDLTPILPLRGKLRDRVGNNLRTLNEILERVGARHAAARLEGQDAQVFIDIRVWSPDRLHLNSTGHQRLAQGIAASLGMEGYDGWSDRLPGPPARRTPVTELAWARTFLVPWVGRRLRGKSSADGRVAKRLTLSPLGPQPVR